MFDFGILFVEKKIHPISNHRPFTVDRKPLENEEKL